MPKHSGSANRAACLITAASTAFALAAPPDSPGGPVGIADGDAHRTPQLTHSALNESGTAVKGDHIADPRTGASPVRSTRAWALAPTAARADALSTAFFVMREPEIAAFCRAHTEIGAATTAADGRITGFGRLAEFVES